MARRKNHARPLNGLLLFDKATGESSNRVLQQVKRLFNAAKAGHTGTLDPLATGLLVVCFGRATKISDFLLTADKQYQVTFQLGVTTTSGDSDGEIVKQKDASTIEVEQIKQAAKQLTGDIEQIPPMYSALKHEGKRLYELARKGEQVERAARNVHIHQFSFIEQQQDLVKMHVHCSKGTYVRTLVEDLGALLTCGAHVVELRRTSLGPFVDPAMHTLPNLEQIYEQGLSELDALLLPIESALQGWPIIRVSSEQMQVIQHGRPFQFPQMAVGDCARIYDADEQFYGMASFNQHGKIVVKCLNESV